jgi:fructose-1,6-bisphosphatase/inositol monophosphatase family enzyme
MIRQPDQLLQRIKKLHAHIRDTVVAAFEQSSIEQLAQVTAEEDSGDTIYAVDRVSEAALQDFFAREIAPHWSLMLIAEGLPGGYLCLPPGKKPDEVEIRVLVDPIDGTRGLMYQKRSAWVLTGIAPNRGAETSLRDVEIAVQTEIPLVKQHLSDVLWATSQTSTQAERYNRLNGESIPFVPQPSRASTIAHGFAMISRFFPGAREELAAIDEAMVHAVLGPPQRGKAHCFEDQYICTGGQLYELMVGHDRFVADLRPLMDRWLAQRGRVLGICCHPYDLASMLVAQQAGVILTNQQGGPLNAPLNVEAEVGWIGYANAAIQAQVEPALLNELYQRGVL